MGVTKLVDRMRWADDVSDLFAHSFTARGLLRHYAFTAGDEGKSYGANASPQKIAGRYRTTAKTVKAHNDQLEAQGLLKIIRTKTGLKVFPQFAESVKSTFPKGENPPFGNGRIDLSKASNPPLESVKSTFGEVTQLLTKPTTNHPPPHLPSPARADDDDDEMVVEGSELRETTTTTRTVNVKPDPKAAYEDQYRRQAAAAVAVVEPDRVKTEDPDPIPLTVSTVDPKLDSSPAPTMGESLKRRGLA